MPVVSVKPVNPNVIIRRVVLAAVSVARMDVVVGMNSEQIMFQVCMSENALPDLSLVPRKLPPRGNGSGRTPLSSLA